MQEYPGLKVCDDGRQLETGVEFPVSRPGAPHASLCTYLGTTSISYGSEQLAHRALLIAIPFQGLHRHCTRPLLSKTMDRTYESRIHCKKIWYSEASREQQ